MEMVLLSTMDKQKENILPRRTANLGMDSIPPFIQLLGRGGWQWDPLLSGQKEVGGDAVLRLGTLGSPRRPGF